MNRVVYCAALVLLMAGVAHGQVLAGTGSSAQRALGLKFGALGCPGVAGVRYTATSSVLGIASVKNGATTGTDFALSDIPDLPCSAASKLLNVPLGIGLLSVHAKVGGVARAINLNACVLDRIYKCALKTWNTAPITALNPTLRTATGAITVIARKEVSGSTSVFTNMLGKLCVNWKFGSITIMSNAPALRPCFARMRQGQGTGGVTALFNQLPNAIVYLSANALAVPEVKLAARTGRFYASPNVNTAVLAAGLAYGAANCNPQLDVTARGDTYPLAYVSFFLANRIRAGRPNAKSLKALCNCVASTKNTQLFTGLADFKAAPAAMKAAASARCRLIVP